MLQIDGHIHIDISTASCHISQLIIQRFALSSECLDNVGTVIWIYLQHQQLVYLAYHSSNMSNQAHPETSPQMAPYFCIESQIMMIKCTIRIPLSHTTK
jgi:uncharacterized protein (UPF0303 family)